MFEKFLGWCQKHRSALTHEWSKGHIQTLCDHRKTAGTMAASDLRPFHVVGWVDGKSTWGANEKRGAIVAVTRLTGGACGKPGPGIEKPTPIKRGSRRTRRILRSSSATPRTSRAAVPEHRWPENPLQNRFRRRLSHSPCVRIVPRSFVINSRPRRYNRPYASAPAQPLPEAHSTSHSNGAAMRAVCLKSRSGPEGLTCEDVPRPVPKVGEVLVRVHAAGVTPTELTWVPTWTTREGNPRSFPVIPGHEFSGDVAAIGAGVTGVAVGDAVYGLNDWFTDGAQGEFCLAPADWVASKPRTVGHDAAAVTPISALTAWQGLIERCGLGTGQRVLIHGGSGAVGAFAVQLAKWRGARVTATASAHNLEYVRSLGADEVIDYRATRFEEQVRDVDVVFDTVGGETLARSWGVCKLGGKLVTVAAAGEVDPDERTKQAFFIVEANRTQLVEIARLIDSGVLRPDVAGTFPLAEARGAYEYKPRHGKVVLRAV